MQIGKQYVFGGVCCLLLRFTAADLFILLAMLLGLLISSCTGAAVATIAATTATATPASTIDTCRVMTLVASRVVAGNKSLHPSRPDFYNVNQKEKKENFN